MWKCKKISGNDQRLNVFSILRVQSDCMSGAKFVHVFCCFIEQRGNGDNNFSLGRPGYVYISSMKIDGGETSK